MSTFEDRYDAEQQISKIVYGYAEALDTGDLPRVGKFFEYGKIRVDGGTDEFVGADGVIAMFRDHNHFYNGIPSTKHVTSNLMIDVAEDGTHASAKSYFTVLQATADLPLQIVIAGRYHDQFALQDGKWVLTDRFEYCDLLGDLTAHLRHNPLT